MQDGGGSTDKDKGMAKIMKQIAALSTLGVKAGITSDVGEDKGKKRVRKTSKSGKKSKRKTIVENRDGPTIAQYAAWNEYGTKDGRIPARPFIRNWIDNNREKIEKTQARLFKQVCEGKISAEEAVAKLGQFAQDGIKRYIITGNFTPNAESTVQRKGSSRPLIDTGVMRNSIRYQVVGKDGE